MQTLQRLWLRSECACVCRFVKNIAHAAANAVGIIIKCGPFFNIYLPIDFILLFVFNYSVHIYLLFSSALHLLARSLFGHIVYNYIDCLRSFTLCAHWHAEPLIVCRLQVHTPTENSTRIMFQHRKKSQILKLLSARFAGCRTEYVNTCSYVI